MKEDVATATKEIIKTVLEDERFSGIEADDIEAISTFAGGLAFFQDQGFLLVPVTSKKTGEKDYKFLDLKTRDMHDLRSMMGMLLTSGFCTDDFSVIKN